MKAYKRGMELTKRYQRLPRHRHGGRNRRTGYLDLFGCAATKKALRKWRSWTPTGAWPHTKCVLKAHFHIVTKYTTYSDDILTTSTKGVRSDSERNDISSSETLNVCVHMR